MSGKFFLIITFTITLFSTFFSEARELSIQQLEERKKLDLERKKRIEKSGKKAFQKEIIITTEIVFVSKERENPPVLSNLDPILEDEGFYGVKLAIEDNLTINTPDIENAQLNQIIDASDLRTFLDEAPNGFNTLITDNGRKLAV